MKIFAVFMVGVIICLGIPLGLCQFLATDKPPVELPACKDITDNADMWKMTVRCTMGSEQWLCIHGKCDRIPRVP